jgi:hypothetical protein
MQAEGRTWEMICALRMKRACEYSIEAKIGRYQGRGKKSVEGIWRPLLESLEWHPQNPALRKQCDLHMTGSCGEAEHGSSQTYTDSFVSPV